MNADRINAKIYAGRGKTAQRIGYLFGIFRPTDNTNPLKYRKPALIYAAFNKGDKNYRDANMPGDAYWYCDADGSKFEAGDYLARCNEVYFVAGKQSLLPIVVVECNRFIQLLGTNKQPVPLGGGIVDAGYSGLCADSASGQSVLDGGGETKGINQMPDGTAGWPCSILHGSGKQRNSMVTPSSSNELEGWMVLLPRSLKTTINAGMMLRDDLGRSYMINGAELTDFGWRVKCTEEHA